VDDPLVGVLLLGGIIGSSAGTKSSPALASEVAVALITVKGCLAGAALVTVKDADEGTVDVPLMV